MKRINPTLTPDLWRLSIISDLIHRDPDDGRTLAACFADLATRTWIRPDGTPCQFSHETLRKWHSRFLAGGLSALGDTRQTPGTRIPEKLGDALIDLRNKHPHWSVQLLLEELQKRQAWNGSQPSKATMYRWCKDKGLLRSKREDSKEARAFEFSAFGALWISDVLHGPKITIHGKKRKTYILGILDDASRFVVSAKFHLSEGIEPLMNDLRQSLLRFGLPQRFYTDNGSAFRSKILHQVGARLDIGLPHTPAYKPQGRGKIERFFRTVREQFLVKTTAKTLEQLDRELQEWVATYHQNPHDGIGGETPLDKRLRIENLCRNLPETINLDALFMQSRLVRLYKDGTFRLQNRLFEAPGAGPAKRIEIFFTPWDLSKAYYGKEHWVARRLDKIENSRRFENPVRQECSHE